MLRGPRHERESRCPAASPACGVGKAPGWGHSHGHVVVSHCSDRQSGTDESPRARLLSVYLPVSCLLGLRPCSP